MTTSDKLLAVGAVVFLLGILLMGLGGRRGPGNWSQIGGLCLVLGILLIGYAGVTRSRNTASSAAQGG